MFDGMVRELQITVSVATWLLKEISFMTKIGLKLGGKLGHQLVCRVILQMMVA